MISIVKPMQPQTVGVNTARYHDHEEPIRWWSHVTEHGKVVLKTCKEQPCPRYLSWPSVRLKCQKYFQHSKLFVAHFLFSWICCENEPVHKCIRLHINRDGKVDNLKTMDDRRKWILLVATCILSLDTVKAAAPSSTSLSITCLTILMLPCKWVTGHAVSDRPKFNWSKTCWI